MTRQPFDEFLAMKDVALHKQLVVINNAIAKGAPDADAAIKWKQYMYANNGKWMDPICTIDSTKKGFAIRFMSAEELSDPLGVLRFANSAMGTWDIPFDSKIKPADITKYVKEAAKNQKNREK
jgi:hypothetical protein